MSFDRRRFLHLAALGTLAVAAPALARPRTGSRGGGSLALSFASFPGIGGIGGAKLADAIWTNTTVKARVADSLPVQLLAARFEGSKPVAGFASPVAKFAPGDEGRTLGKLLSGDMYFPDQGFLPGDLFLPGDMYLPDRFTVAGESLGTKADHLFSTRESQSLLGGAIARSPGFRPKGLVLFAFALVSPGAGMASQGLVFELDGR
ncbi:hypothetical protein [Arenimonas sp.]|uniref:hypothetical protein n=1 Tax=Arenimonas sp. TaxID=1872635 RepID=UPI0035B0F0D6